MSKNIKNNILTDEVLSLVRGITTSGLDFMEGLEKGESDDFVGKTVTVDNYGFMRGDDGEYVVFTTKEDTEHFFFGSTVVTTAFVQLKSALTEEQNTALMEMGLPVKFTKLKSKNKREYIKAEFFPKED